MTVSFFYKQLTKKVNYGKIRIRFCPHMGKYGLQKSRISAYFTQYLVEHFQTWLRATRKCKFYQCANIIGAPKYKLSICAKIKSAKLNPAKVRGAQ